DDERGGAKADPHAGFVSDAGEGLAVFRGKKIEAAVGVEISAAGGGVKGDEDGHDEDRLEDDAEDEACNPLGRVVSAGTHSDWRWRVGDRSEESDADDDLDYDQERLERGKSE